MIDRLNIFNYKRFGLTTTNLCISNSTLDHTNKKCGKSGKKNNMVSIIFINGMIIIEKIMSIRKKIQKLLCKWKIKHTYHISYGDTIYRNNNIHTIGDVKLCLFCKSVKEFRITEISLCIVQSSPIDKIEMELKSK